MRNTVYPWWLVLLQGLGAILVGIFMLTAPGADLGFFVQTLGWYWLISGVLSLVSMFVNPRLQAWKLVSGILGVIVGFLVIGHPLWSGALVPTTLTWVLGIYGFIAGLVLLVGAARGGGWGMAALGALAVLLGVALIVAPFVSTLAIIIIGGVLSIVGGIVALINALDMRREDRARETAVEEAVRTVERRPEEKGAEIVERHPVDEAVQIVERSGEEGSTVEEDLPVEEERMD
ncbi:MAG: HdeD family acid-resistance protein [Chloroflexi bacterium]|nr:HdeD family acid-resistance protein [Chloroflexota bacterium]